MKENFFKLVSPNKIIFFLSWFLCFSIALPHTILPGKAGFISLLVFTLWVLEGNLKTKIRILYNSKLFLSVFAFIFALSLSMLWTEYTHIGLVRLSAFKYYLFLIPVLITSLTRKQALDLLRAFVLGILLHAFFIILFHFKLINMYGNITLYSPYSVYAPFFVFSSFYCLFYSRSNFNNKNIIRGFVYLFCSLVLIYIIFTNNGRSGQIAFICSAILALVLLHKNWQQTTIYFTITAALIATISLSSLTVKSTSNSALHEIEQILKGNYYGSWGARWGLLVTNYEVIKQNPVFGVGLGDTQDEMHRVIARGKNQASYSIAYYDGSHNHYITILTSAGIIGFILYITIHVFLFRLPIKHKETKYLSLIFLTILIITSIADDILIYKPYNIYFAIMIALFINLSLGKKHT
ncbi:MAG: O-antigen ligase family protein [Gammaproteobacteria bacterium]|nr:O-antigen ligase family protein [Gammaproteobacteria bacterium]